MIIGKLTLRKLELREDFFLLDDLFIDVEASLIDEYNITIPWKSVQSDVSKHF